MLHYMNGNLENNYWFKGSQDFRSNKDVRHSPVPLLLVTGRHGGLTRS